jgi:hypothetical protein
MSDIQTGQRDGCSPCGNCNRPHDECECWDNRTLGATEEFVKVSDSAEPSRAEFLAEAHWDYVESVLRAHDEDEDIINRCKHHYITAFVHGWKHAREDKL